MFLVHASSGIWTPGSSESSDEEEDEEDEDEEDDDDDEAARTDDGRGSRGGGAGAARWAGGTCTSLAVPPQTAYLSPRRMQSTLCGGRGASAWKMRILTSLLYFAGGHASSLFQGPFCKGSFQAPDRKLPEEKGSGEQQPIQVKSSPSTSFEACTSMTNRNRLDAPQTYNDG